MTYRTLTALALRFSSLLLFTKIFDHFHTFALTSLYRVFIDQLPNNPNSEPSPSFSIIWIVLFLSNIILSTILFFKAEWVTTKLIKEDSDITIGLTAEKLIKAILLSTGILWLSISIFSVADLYDYILFLIAFTKDIDYHTKSDFSPIYFLLQTLFALLFIFRTDNISRYLERKINRVN